MSTRDTSMDLHSLQVRFGQAMQGEDATRLAGCVHPAGRLSPAQSVEVYRRNRVGALLRVLADVYPVCAQLLGERSFRAIAIGYQRLHPSEHGDLNLYGEQFADFLQRYCDEQIATTHALRCLPELARLEWSYHCAYYAADDMTFDLTQFAQVEGDECDHLVFDLSRSLALFSSLYPLYSIWHSRTALNKAAHKACLCVCRDDLRPVLMRLPVETYGLLTAMAAGTTLGALSRQFEDLVHRLPPLIGKGWVVSFHFKTDA